MAVGFFYGQARNQRETTEESASFPPEFIQITEEKINELHFSIQPLTEIDPYGDTVIPLNKLEPLLKCIENFLVFKQQFPWLDKEDIQDLVRLREFLLKAKKEKKTIVAIGD
ncbi:hypothetical protein ACSFB8_03460 [Enterococcus faecalis]